jgi:hypothetical protein
VNANLVNSSDTPALLLMPSIDLLSRYNLGYMLRIQDTSETLHIPQLLNSIALMLVFAGKPGKRYNQGYM